MKVSDILEKWDKEAKINPEKKGMFDNKTEVQLQAELDALKKAGPHPEGSAGFTKMKELEFAIRAKNAKGDKWDKPVSEEWDVKHTGENTNKSISKLKKEETSARKRGDTKSIRQKNFAIQAKRHWGH